jgi:hypothetical protein
MSRKRTSSELEGGGHAVAASSPARHSGASAAAAAFSTAAPVPTHSNNPLGYRKGAVVRVKMLHFMIYNEMEMRPGPGLNLLLGPNGSGQCRKAN